MEGNIRILRAIQDHLAVHGESWDTDIFDSLVGRYRYVEASRVRALLSRYTNLFEKVSRKEFPCGDTIRIKNKYRLKGSVTA